MGEKVSVIIPIYNAERFLIQCLDSVMQQTYGNLEIILVDDGSIDSSGLICDKYAACDKRVKVLHQQNGGLVSARKAGVREATGTYITMVDSDDWISSDMVEKMLEKGEKYHADVVLSGVIYVNENGMNSFPEILPEGVYDLFDRTSLAYDYFFLDKNDSAKRGIRGNIWSRLFRKEIIIENQLLVDTDIINGEDDAVLFPCLMKSHIIYSMGECLYYCRRRNDSMSTSKESYSIKEMVLLEQRLKQCAKKHPFADMLLEQIDYYMCIRLQQYIFQFSVKKEKTFPMYAVPYEVLEKGNKIILYGAGTVGKSYMYQLRHSRYCDVVGWVDKVEGENVQSVSSIMQKDFDYILLAAAREAMAKSMRETIATVLPESEIRKRVLWVEPVRLNDCFVFQKGLY